MLLCITGEDCLWIQVHHEMNAPLAHYFIYTGHNSYLSGSQHFSKSSIEPIEKALKDGVRVIELDLWPNSAEDDVDVCHWWYEVYLRFQTLLGVIRCSSCNIYFVSWVSALLKCREPLETWKKEPPAIYFFEKMKILVSMIIKWPGLEISKELI